MNYPLSSSQEDSLSQEGNWVESTPQEGTGAMTG